MKSAFKSLISHGSFPACFLLTFGLAAYGRLMIQAGTFGDDPQMLYAFHRFGLAGYKYSLGWSRPFGIWIYAPLHILFGNHLVLWQMGAILLRTLSAWLLLDLIGRVKEEWRIPALWAAAACLLYPGFSQQAHAMQFSLHWAALSASLASQILMLRALEADHQKRRWTYMASSWLLACLGIFSTEYFIGLELLRFLILWVYLDDKKESIDFNKLDQQQTNKHTLLSALYRWLPYLIPVLAFSAWRLFAAQIKYPSPLLLDDLRANPGEALSILLTRIPSDMQRSVFSAWKNAILHVPYFLESWHYIGFGIAASALIWFFLRRLSTNNPKTSKKNAVIMIGCGLALTLVSGLPLWISKMPLALSFPENRATLCLMVGVCLTLAGLASLVYSAGSLMIAILLGFSLVFQFDICLVYANSWEKIQTFYQQLTICAPGLEPGTTLLYEEPFLLSYPANSLSALLNWTYDADNHGEEMSFDMLRVSERLGNSITALEPDLLIQHGTFRGSTSQVLVVTLDAQGCPRFLYANDDTSEAVAPILRQASRIANPEVIIENPTQPVRPPSFLLDKSLEEDCSCD